jgi:hypothetical protein
VPAAIRFAFSGTLERIRGNHFGQLSITHHHMIDNVSYGTEPNGAAITQITLEPNNFRIGTVGWKPARSWVFWERECNGSSVLVNPENDAWEIALPD